MRKRGKIFQKNRFFMQYGLLDNRNNLEVNKFFCMNKGVNSLKQDERSLFHFTKSKSISLNAMMITPSVIYSIHPNNLKKYSYLNIGAVKSFTHRSNTNPRLLYDKIKL